MTFPAQSFQPAPAVAAAVQWWRDAGVDLDVLDEAADWLAATEVPGETAATEAAAPAPVLPKAPPPPPRERLGGDPAGWPQDLAAFQAWWLTEPSLDAGQVEGRVAPRGAAGAEVMVLVDHPDSEDGERLLSGPRGRLLDAILSAWRVDQKATYVASLLPRHMPLPDWEGLQAAGLGELTLHHVALAAPKRLITFGSHVSSLLGHNPAKSAETLQQTYQVGANIPGLAAPGLETLMARPRGKPRLWQALLDWQEP